MEAENSINRLNYSSNAPAWSSWLGIITIVFGIFLTASHGNEILKQVVIAPDSAATVARQQLCGRLSISLTGLMKMKN